MILRFEYNIQRVLYLLASRFFCLQNITNLSPVNNCILGTFPGSEELTLQIKVY